MIALVYLCLVAAAFAADLPKPTLVHLASGDIEISVDGTYEFMICALVIYFFKNLLFF